MEESYEDLYENAPVGYISTRLDGSILRVNETFLSLTGYKRDEVVGRRWAHLLTAGGRIFYETHYAPLLQMQGRVREIAVDVVCASGKRLPVLVNSVLHDDIGVIRTVVFDATERREYERELLRERERAEASEARARLLARTLQQSFIPPALPQVPGLDVGGVYRPAGTGDEVGGDFYDVFATDGAREWAVVLGDVCGKGAGAAAVTAMARFTVRAAAVQGREPSAVLQMLHDVLVRSDLDRFLTAVFARVEGSTLTVSSGGHPLPLWVNSAGEIVPVGQPGSLIGVLGLELAPSDARVELTPGDAMVFYTDGVTEARRGNEFFGEHRLRHVLAASAGDDVGASAMASAVVDAVVEYQDGMPRDDIAVVVVKVPA